MASTIELPASPNAPASDHTPDTGALLFIGTATVLLRCAGFTILTDPNFLHQGEHAKLGYGLRSRRLSEPAARIDELPALDFVVLSHHHGDHFDDVAARDLDPTTPIVTTGHAARKLRRQGFRSPIELATWESQTFVRDGNEVTVTAMPAKHAPQPLQTLLPPVMGSILDFRTNRGRTYRMYVTGDTLLFDDLAEIPRRCPGIDLAIVHLGGTRVLGVLVTMDAEQGVQALRLIQPEVAVPVHFDDYTVFKSPLADFVERAARADLETELVYLNRGDTWTFDMSDATPD